MNIEYNEVSVSASDDLTILTFDRSCSIYLYVMILCIRDIMVPSSCFTNNNDMTFLHIMWTLSLLYEMLMCAGNKLN